MKIKIVLILVLFCMLFGACAPEGKAVGRWVDVDGVYYEFYKDGTVVIESGWLTVSGSYEFIDKDTMKLTLDGILGVAGPSMFDVSFSGSQMSLSAGGQSIVLEKAK